MRIMVFGKNGQVAQSLAEAAVGMSVLELTTVGRELADLTRPGSAASAIAAFQPECVINAAAYTAVDQAEDEPELAFRINEHAAGEVAEASRAAGAKLIHISTDYVFDGRATRAYREEDKTNPINVYGQSKLAGEVAVRAGNPEHMIIRTSWVYSPFGRNFVRTMMLLADERSELTVVDDQLGCPTSAVDLAEALLKICLLNRPFDGRTFHLTGDGQTSWCQLAFQVMREREEHGLRAARVRPIATADWTTKASRPANSSLDCSAIAAAYGVNLPPWRHSLSRCVTRLARSRAI
jgi:dTDP-4-dehydrorhamnose reductase